MISPSTRENFRIYAKRDRHWAENVRALDGCGPATMKKITEYACSIGINVLSIRAAGNNGQPVASKAVVDAALDVAQLNNSLKPESSVGHLKKGGVRIEDAVSDDQKATLISLETKTEPEYWVGYYNFYVITRYNHSALYAMVVYQLSEEILAESIHNIAALTR